MPFLMIRNDITKMNTDAVVNPANPELLQGSGTSSAIYKAAGERKLTKACRKIGFCDIGHAVITPGFKLSAKYIIHAVCPMWKGGCDGEKDFLYNAYFNSMKLADENGLKSIAFPLLSSGNYRFPKKEALKIASAAINDFLLTDESGDMMVYLVLYDNESMSVSQKLFDSINEYIDDNYVDEQHKLFEQYDVPCVSRFDNSRMRETIETYAPRASVFEDDIVAGIDTSASPEVQTSEDTLQPWQPEVLKLEEILNSANESFPDMLLRLIDERGMTDAQAYKKANIDRKLFSKIKNNPGYTPTKKTILAFALALELSRAETDELLMKAGYALSNSSKFDLIITYFITNKIYDIFTINEVLFTYEQPLLG